MSLNPLNPLTCSAKGSPLNECSELIVRGRQTVYGDLHVLNPTISCSPTTGCGIFAGGVGIQGELNLGSSLRVCASAELLGDVAVSKDLNVSRNVIIGNSCKIFGRLWVGDTLETIGDLQVSRSITSEGNICINSKAESTDTSTGGLIIKGGAGVSCNVNVGGTLRVVGDVHSGGKVFHTDVTESHTPYGGAVTVAGGIGVQGNLNVARNLSVGSTANFAQSVLIRGGSARLGTIDLTDVSGRLTATSMIPGLRLSMSPETTAPSIRYTNSVDIFGCGSSYLDTFHEALQITTTTMPETKRGAFAIISRCGEVGAPRPLVLQAGGSTRLVLNTDGIITTVADLHVQGAISTSRGLKVGKVSIEASGGSTSFTLKLPPSLAQTDGHALVSDVDGNLTWREMVTAEPFFERVRVSSTAVDAVEIVGGLTVGGPINLGGTINLGGNRPLFAISPTSRALIINPSDHSNAGTVVNSSLSVTGQVDFDGGSVQVNENEVRIANGTKLIMAGSSGGLTLTADVEESKLVDSNVVGVCKGWMMSNVGGNSFGHQWTSGGRTTMKLNSEGTLNISQMQLGVEGIVIRAPPSVKPYHLTLPAQLPTSGGEYYVTAVEGRLSWRPVLGNSGTPKFRSAHITGDLHVGKKMEVKSELSIGDGEHRVTLRSAQVSEKSTYTLPTTLPHVTGQVLASDSAGNMFWKNTAGDCKSFTQQLENNVMERTIIPGLTTTGGENKCVFVAVRTTHTEEFLIQLSTWFTFSGSLVCHQKVAGEHERRQCPVIFTVGEGGQIFYTSEDVPSWIGTDVTWCAHEVFRAAPEGGYPIRREGSDNVTLPQDITDFRVYGSQFARSVQVVLTNRSPDKSMRCLVHLTGVRQPKGTWILSKNITGVDCGVDFHVMTDGQVRYTTPPIEGFLSLVFLFHQPGIPLQSEASFDTVHVDRSFLRSFDTVSTATWRSHELVISGTTALNSAAFTVLSWMPFVSGLRFEGCDLRLEKAGIYAINIEGDGDAPTRVFVRNKESSDPNYIMSSSLTEFPRLNGTYALQAGTSLQVVVEVASCIRRVQFSALTVSVTLTQQLYLAA